jgi:hypothetical protein
MKKSIFFIIALALGLFACAQTPPKAVTDNFAEKFTGASGVKWEQEEENEWEAEFKMNGAEMSASFDKAGAWLETEKEMKKKDLPATVTNTIKAQFPKAKIEEASEIQTPDFKGYEIALENGETDIEVLVTADGKLTVNKESKEEDEKDEK